MIRHKGARLPIFVPCLEGQCPERMQLEGYKEPGHDLVYRCMRTIGHKGRANEIYTANCFFHDHPYSADDYAYWHRTPEGKRKADPTDRDNWETAI